MSNVLPDLTETFPACPSFGFTAEPEYLVKITSREGGFERRDLKWAKPLMRYTGVPMGNRAMDDILDVYEFWQAMRGMWTGFRFRDLLDYRSVRATAALLAETPHDQPLEASLTTAGQYRLVKNYTTKSGRTFQSRYITRPIGSTIVASNSSGAVQTDFTIDEATGILTPGGGFSGTPGFWGGQFDVYVRFAAQFNPALNFNSGSVTVQLNEIRQVLA